MSDRLRGADAKANRTKECILSGFLTRQPPFLICRAPGLARFSCRENRNKKGDVRLYRSRGNPELSCVRNHCEPPGWRRPEWKVCGWTLLSFQPWQDHRGFGGGLQLQPHPCVQHNDHAPARDTLRLYPVSYGPRTAQTTVTAPSLL